MAGNPRSSSLTAARRRRRTQKLLRALPCPGTATAARGESDDQRPERLRRGCLDALFTDQFWFSDRPVCQSVIEGNLRQSKMDRIAESERQKRRVVEEHRALDKGRTGAENVKRVGPERKG